MLLHQKSLLTLSKSSVSNIHHSVFFVYLSTVSDHVLKSFYRSTCTCIVTEEKLLGNGGCFCSIVSSLLLSFKNYRWCCVGAAVDVLKLKKSSSSDVTLPVS